MIAHIWRWPIGAWYRVRCLYCGFTTRGLARNFRRAEHQVHLVKVLHPVSCRRSR